ncbi:MAG: PrsW family intramembrane metalloprotease [Acidobacteria bacterium]|nr:PrsW family intramembrane metalloprotease [Acidobacteriota bacterium]
MAMRNFSAAPYPAPPATPTEGRTRRRSGLKWAGASIAALVALLFGLLTLWIIGYETGPVALLAGLVIAALPVPIYVTLVLWLDRYEAEPAWMLATAFFWGALVAVFFALLVNSLGQLLVEGLFNKDVAGFYGLVISAPVVEESAKALALFALYFWKRDEFDGVLDGIVYAAMIGLGFAMTENVKYYAEAVTEGGAFGTFIVRGMFSPYAHPLFTSMTGIGLGVASQSSRRAVRTLAPLAGFALAMILHCAWNASIYFSERLDNAWVALLMYFMVMVPVFAAVILAVIFALRREGRILREHLRCDVEIGLLSPDDYDCLCSIRRRMSASFRALARGGLTAWRARRQLNGLASELAFHRNRVARGLASRDDSDSQREAMYMRTLYELRARLGSVGS